MGRISPKFGIKILAILGFTLVLGFFILPNSAKAQECTDLGYICGHIGELSCCSGLECISNRCVKTLGSYCSSRDDCHTPRFGGDTYIMGCFYNACCGRHWYPCSSNADCCNDPSGDGAFYCMGNNVCGGWCDAPYCTDWVSQGCHLDICATNTDMPMYQTRTCTNGICNTKQCIADCSCNTPSSSVCYNNDRYWNDGCGNRTNNVREDCGDSFCGSWYECGCQDSRYKKNCQDCATKGCSNDACTNSTTTNTQQGIDCGTSYCENWVNAGCNGRFVKETRTCHNRGCASNACFDTPYIEERNTTDCGINYCENWATCGCDGNFIKECRTCHARGCNNGSCFDNPSTEERRITDCNISDGCVGATYRDYSCSAGGCIYSSQACDSRCDSPPNTPILVAPNNNTWINSDPIFQATSLNPEGGNIRIHFNLQNNPDGVGNWVASGNNSQWGPVNLGGTCIDEWWQAQAEDECNLFSNWSGWWRARVDKDLPTTSISYPTGTVNYLIFQIVLSATDTCSGIALGDVDVSIDHGATWTNNGLFNSGSMTTNFMFTGTGGSCYVFRYRARDYANNWSSFSQGGELCIDISIPTALIDYPNNWINSNSFNVTLTENDPGGSIAQGNVDIQTRQGNAGFWSAWSDYSTTIDDFVYSGQHCYFYKFRYQAVDNAGNWSLWSDPGYIARIDTVSPTVNISYPTGIINSTKFTVNLTDSDDCSGVAERNLQLSTDNGAWENHPSTIGAFDFTGSYGHTYKFRYRARDTAGNWSNFVEGGVAELKSLPSATPSNLNWTFCPGFGLELTWDYSDSGNLPQVSFQVQIDNNSDFSSLLFDSQEISESRHAYTLAPGTLLQLMKGVRFFWQVRVKNSAGDWSPWGVNSNLPVFFKKLETYSTF